MSPSQRNETPMMRQFNAIKQSHADKILFFRMGDFYEMFGEDAIKASKILQIQLTSRDKNKENALPMCGIPVHAYDQYLNKLVAHGLKVAVCEQLEDASESKGIVKRDVVQVITPGTITSNELLDSSQNNYICCIRASKLNQEIALVFCDLSTGDLEYGFFTEKAQQNTIELINLYAPSEIIVAEGDFKNLEVFFKKGFSSDLINKISFSQVDNYYFDLERCKKEITNHYHVLNLASFGIENENSSVMVIGALLKYLKKTQFNDLLQINSMRQITIKNHMSLDASTIKNLELFHQNSTDKNDYHLFKLLNKSTTAMGERLLRKWMLKPLLDIQKISERFDAIDELLANVLFSSQIKQCFKQIGDVERMLSRICSANPKIIDVIKFKQSIAIFPVFKSIIKNQFSSKLLAIHTNEFLPMEDLNQILGKALREEPSLQFKDGGYIASNYNEKLDQLRSLTQNSKRLLAELESKERQNSSIHNLKIKYNRIFGYYFEVSNSNKNLVPEHFIRKQTLSNAERYITLELKDLEESILGAEDEIVTLEKKLFLEICERIKEQVTEIQKSTSVIALFDVLLALANASLEYNYIRPQLHQNKNKQISIKQGRHPVIENIDQEMTFIPNDIDLQIDHHFMMVITGPNMGGKSTYMRQVALIIYMCQIGSFIPASEAYLPIFDRIFTRVGASDNLSQGQSTFMVEMNEAASIINNATENSLIILDEIGRGTSTFDGISIAWAIIEHLYSLSAITLFATHYHELTTLGDEKHGIVNYHVGVKEDQDDIIFLRKILKGKSDKSYGIQVARLAGLPDSIINTAQAVMAQLETHENEMQHPKLLSKHTETEQESKEQMKKSDAVRDYLKSINLNVTTPFDALQHLNELIKQI